MNSLNIVISVTNAIVFAWLVRGAYKLANKNHARFSSIDFTIQYWRDHLNAGDKFVIFPKKFESLSDAHNAFLQFKIHILDNKKIVDLVYPLNSNSKNDITRKSELISLAKFFEIKNQMYWDENHLLSFYFFEIDPDVPNHILFLVSLGKLQRGFELSTEIGIDVITSPQSNSAPRFMP